MTSPLARSILIVEDDQAANQMMTLLTAKKFPDMTVHAAYNGQMGVELFRGHMPDIVITDINMPVMDGIEMAKEIKSIKPSTRFIVVTGYSDKKYLEQFSQIGYCGYLLKPLEFTHLFMMVERCIDEIRNGSV